jgi:hypothetical protein
MNTNPAPVEPTRTHLSFPMKLPPARPTRVLSVALLLLAGVLAGASDLAGQALCAAPHSVPSLRPSGSIESIEPLTGWYQLTYYRQRSDQFFTSDGTEQELLGEGLFTANSIFLTSAFGITEGLDIWGQVPIHYIQTSSASGGDSRVGLGDVRFAARIGSDLFRLPRIPLLVRGGVKLPGSDFPVDATIIPISEGQVDWELGLETGYYVSGRFPVQLVGAGGYRWRTLNEDSGRKPGDEWYFYAGVGGPQSGWRWGLSFEALLGQPPVQDGLELPAGARELFQIGPSVAFQFAGTELELAARIPLAGKNLVSGTSFTVGFYMPWALP